MKGIFVDTNFYFLALTVFIAALHMLFDILAFKNDIAFWRNRKSMAGLSMRLRALFYLKHLVARLHQIVNNKFLSIKKLFNHIKKK